MDTGRAFIEHSRHLLSTHYLPRIERSVDRLTDEQLWWRPNDASNSAGNLVLHLAGNIRQWIVAGVGGAPDTRRRAQEFEERDGPPRSDVLARLRRSVGDADAVLSLLPPAELGEPRTIQQHEVTVFEAIYHVVEHCSMHAGQIMYIAKLHTGDLGFYDLANGKPTPTWN